MDKQTSTLVENTADREIVISRVFDAPRELVWKAWTDPEHIVQWWGPHGFTTTIQQMDLRPGGVWQFVMHGPDGADYENHSVFVEVTKPERIVFTHGGGKQGGPAVKFESTWSFTELGGQTEVTIRMVFETAAERNTIAREYGAVEGGKQTLERLGEQLARMSGSSPDVPQDLVITRVIDAPRALVFKAWTDSKHVEKWWGPQGFTNPVCELDVRPGGSMLIHMRGPDGSVHPMSGTYREIAEPKRLAFVSSALDEEGKPVFEILTTITFEEQGKKTLLTMRAHVLSMTEKAAPHLAGAEIGWNQTLDRLIEYVARM